MIAVTSRARLLAGAALGLGLATLAPQQAQAACTVAANAVTCGTTTTTNTTNAGGTPASDRNYPVDTSAGNFTGTVSTGAVVDGFGLAFTNTVGGANTLNVVNNGAVQVNAGNLASAGGNDALSVTAIGATNVNYTGTGTVTNLGTTGAALSFDMQGTGNLTAVIGGNLTSAFGNTDGSGEGVVVIGTGAAPNTATYSVTTAAGTTITAEHRGVMIYIPNGASAANSVIVNNAIVRGLAANSLEYGILGQTNGTGGMSITNNGALGTATDRMQTTGILAWILGGASTSPLSVTGTGAIWSAGGGIGVINAGTGTTTVNYTGAINTTGATGVGVNATTGATNVTLGAVTAATNAVDVVSTGAQTITLNGATTGTTGSGLVSNTTGARSITVGATGNVIGGTQAILLAGTGTATIANAGTIGAAPTGLAINGTAAGATTITNTGTLNGRVTLGAGADTLTNTGTINTQGTLDFGAGADTFANTGAGIVNLTGNATLANVETITQSGRINLNTFTLTGPAIAFVNAGTIDTNGNAGLAGFTTFSNSGTLDLAAGTFTAPAGVFTNTGTILADEGASTITGQSSFANSGTIDLQDGAVGDVLTIDSAFVGSGGSNLLLDFNGTTADRLVIAGAASGVTTVNPTFVGGSLINLGGVLVVDTVSSPASAFVLGTVTGDTPLVDFSLVQSGADFFLISAPTRSAFDPMAVPGLATSLWYQSADEVIAETRKPATTVGFSVWGNGYYSRDDFGDHDTATIEGVGFDVDNELETKRHGVQAGVDYGFGGGRIGLTGGYAWAKADSDFDLGLKAKGWNAGLYGQFGGITGFHGEILAKYDRYKANFSDGAFDGFDFDIRQTGIDGALGYRFGIGGDANLDANVGLSHVRSKIDNIDAFGFNYDISKVTSTRGRAGLRATFGGGWAPYVSGTVFREFDGDANIDLFDGGDTFGLDTDGKGTWGRLEAGLSGNDGPGPILAAWADLGDKHGFGVRAGWRLGGRAAEAAPPPPPPPSPPPPPPPATQTCPDGSVILATDNCPAPPPPPPPPPPAPERG